MVCATVPSEAQMLWWALEGIRDLYVTIQHNDRRITKFMEGILATLADTQAKIDAYASTVSDAADEFSKELADLKAVVDKAPDVDFDFSKLDASVDKLKGAESPTVPASTEPDPLPISVPGSGSQVSTGDVPGVQGQGTAEEAAMPTPVTQEPSSSNVPVTSAPAETAPNAGEPVEPNVPVSAPVESTTITAPAEPEPAPVPAEPVDPTPAVETETGGGTATDAEVVPNVPVQSTGDEDEAAVAPAGPISVAAS